MPIEKVYIINDGVYDDFRIRGVVSTVENAEQFMDQFPNEDWNMPIEMIVDDLMKIPKDKNLYFARVEKLDMDRNHITELRLDDCYVYLAEYARDDAIHLDVNDNLMMRLWAKDKKDAEKLALERADKYYKNAKE